jgi:hypothetical protein
MQFFAQVCDDIGVAILAGQHDGRIAGEQLLQPVDQHRDEEQRRNNRREALEQKAGHR